MVFHGEFAHGALVMKLGRAFAVEHAPALAANAIRSSYFIVRANARHTVVGDPMDQVAFNGALGARVVGSAAAASGADKHRREQSAIQR